MIKFMVDSSHHPVTDAQMTSSICELADLNYTLHPLVNENKDEVIRYGLEIIEVSLLLNERV
jgi:hypothetical protein